MKVIAELDMTCGACPAQWEGRTTDDEYVYIRYRYGILSLDIAHETVYNEAVGGPMDGAMSWDDMFRHLSEHITQKEW